MLSTLILNLLYRNDCVIVPGLGAFITRRVASSYDEQRGLMLPPRKEVAFNPDLRHTDGLLADFMTARGAAADYADAQGQIESFVSAVMEKVDAGGVYMLPELGSLTLIDGRLTFEPVSGLNALIDSYGLAPVAAERSRANVLGNLGSVDVRKAVASAAAVAAFLLVSPSTSDSGLVRADMTQPFLQSARLGDEMQEAQAPQDKPETAIEVEELMEPATNVDSYCIVVASFLTRQEAQDYIASMRARGVTDLSVLDYDGRVRVIAAQYPDHDEAVRANRDIRTLQGFEKAWVLKVTQ